MFGLYYNKKLFREAGIVDAQGEARPPATREEFLDAARKLTRDTDGNGKPDQWGFVFTWQRNIAYTLMRQWGGEMFSPDLSRCTLGEPRNVQALQFCADLIHKEHVAPSPENFDAWIGFRQGKVAMAMEGVWMMPDLRKQTDLEYAGAPVPRIGPQDAVFASSHQMCLRKGLEGEKLRAAWRFVKFLSENSLDWAEGGQVPVRPSLRATERFKAMAIQAAFARQIPYIRFQPAVPFNFEYLTEYDFAVERALRATVPPRQALDEAAAKVDAIVQRHRRMLREAGRTGP
jgi:multiple sugar transport system substrate-binding protein